jgi:cellulose biosynthesis protein BcsQ
MPISEMNQPADYLPRRIMRIDDHLSLLTPDEYNSRGGITYSAAKLFWDTVISLGYDYVVVDTMPSFGAPDRPDEWTDISLTFALIAGPFRAIYVIPFTPDPWGHEGLTKTRDLLVRENRQQLAVPVVVCNDAGSVAENVPTWLQNDGWRDRLIVVPYNHRIRGDPKTLKLRATLFHDALKMYQPVTKKVIAMAKQAGVGG